MNHWASNDLLFADGHYVEDWEHERFAGLSPALQTFLRDEAARGNKLVGVILGVATLQSPPTTGIFGLPEGLAFLCPISYEANVICYESDQAGVIVAVETYDRLYPSGLEPEEEPWRKEQREEQERWMRDQGWTDPDEPAR